MVDLNADGWGDLAVANVGSNSVSVLLGTGDGTFQEAIHFATGTYPRALIAADMNLDAKIDLVVTNEGSRTLSVLLGRGDGTLEPKVDFDTRGRPVAMTAGDWNGDGWTDIATVDQDSSVVSVLLGQGDGTLGGAASLATVPSPVAIGSADLDGDGSQDLVVVNMVGLSVHLGHGNGGFGTRNDHSGRFDSRALAIGDVSGDGWPDVVVTSSRWFHEFNNSTISIWLNDGNGTLNLGAEYWTAGEIASLATLDLDRDSHADIAVVYDDEDYFTRDADSRLLVLRGRGNGTFDPPAAFATGGIPMHLAVADLNADGNPDVTVVNWTGAVSVLLGSGAGAFGSAAEIPKAAGAQPPRAAVVGDLNGDGVGDVVAYRARDQAIGVALGNQDGTPGPWSVLEVEYDERVLLLADMNGDSWPDLVTANGGTNSVWVLPGRGDGSFDTPIATETGAYPVSIRSGDLNDDGTIDVVTANANGRNASVLLGLGDGTFRTRIDVEVTGRPYEIAVGDLSGDGRADLAVSSEIASRGTVSVFYGNGDGTFVSGPSIEAAKPPRNLCSVDLDRDGGHELLAAVHDPVLSFSDELWSWRGDGHGGFQPGNKLGVWRVIAAVVATDLDGDETPDIAIADRTTNTVAVLAGRGNGTFFPPVEYGTGSNPTGIAGGDLNADRRPDLVVPTPGSYTVTILLNLTRTTPVLVGDLVAEASAGRVRLQWTLAAEARTRFAAVQVQRADVAEGVYMEITRAPLIPEQSMSFEDTHVVTGRDYDYRLVLTDRGGTAVVVGPVRARLDTGIPERTILYPPFEPVGGGAIQIRYAIATAPTQVSIAIHDVRGRRIWISPSQVRQPGTYVQAWDRRDAGGRLAPRGIYFVTLRAGSLRASVKLPLLGRNSDAAGGAW